MRLQAVTTPHLGLGAAVNRANADGSTALLFAAMHGHTTTAEALLREGADVDLSDNKNRSPLMWACHGAHRPVVEVLLRYGADIECTDRLWFEMDAYCVLFLT